MDKRRWSGVEIRDYTAERAFSEADRHIIGILKGLNPETLIEIGCGPGIICRRSPFINRYICTDCSFGFLKVTGESCLKMDAVCCDGISLPFADSSAECILAMAVLHHLDSDVLCKALNEVYRVLKKGGHFILLEDWCFSAGETSFEEEARKIRFRNGTGENHLAKGTWLYLLESAGFSIAGSEWVNRPFHSSNFHLMKWPESERIVRMHCFTGVKPL